MTAERLDHDWLQAHPLPALTGETDKNSRGRVLAIGGARSVPGALALTGEAALRVGAGKVQIATVRSLALPLGLTVPEAGVIELPETEDGEIGQIGPACTESLGRCDVVVAGPGISDQDAASRLLDALLATCGEVPLLLDALAITAAHGRADRLRAVSGPLVLTPHLGEMATLLGVHRDAVMADLPGTASRAAERFDAVVVLKGTESWIAEPAGTLLHYEGGGAGLAIGGSGDILAGCIAGLLSRGAQPRTAAAWGVWLHGEAGRTLAARGTPLGFLARELLPELPRLLAR